MLHEPRLVASLSRSNFGLFNIVEQVWNQASLSSEWHDGRSNKDSSLRRDQFSCQRVTLSIEPTHREVTACRAVDAQRNRQRAARSVVAHILTDRGGDSRDRGAG